MLINAQSSCRCGRDRSFWWWPCWCPTHSFLANLCRACQAVINGLLVELRLEKICSSVIGNKMNTLIEKIGTNSCIYRVAFVVDFWCQRRISLSAANFFVPKIRPLQRLRWLMTLKQLHELKGQWLEAPETLILVTRTTTDPIPHVKEILRTGRLML